MISLDISSLLKDHVYAAIALGSLIEGETTVVLAGFAAHQGYAPWWKVTALAALINFVLDQIYYALGRWRGEQLLARFSGLQRGVLRMNPHIHRHRRWIVFGVRFLYGLRTAGPIALGVAHVPGRDFLIFNALGAIIWAVLFSALGYVFGRAISVVLSQAANYEWQAIGIIFAVGLAYWLWRRIYRADKVPH